MNNLYNKYNKLLKLLVSIIEILTYTIAVIIITISISKGVYIYISEFNTQKAYNDVRLILGKAISLSLTFILCIEVLKVFYIKSYQQMILIVSLTLLKIIIGFYLEYELNSIKSTN